MYDTRPFGVHTLGRRLGIIKDAFLSIYSIILTSKLK